MPKDKPSTDTPEQAPESGTADKQDGDQTVAEDLTGNSATDLAAEVERLSSELENQKDEFLRARAETENVRRRSQTEVANARKFAIEGFARELLQVKDSLDLAGGVELQEEADDAVKNMLQGVELTSRQMETVFEKFGIQAVTPEIGDKFDPERHMAMTMQASDEVAANHILNVIQKGYSLKERLLRPAMVVVAKAAEQSDGVEEVTDSGDDTKIDEKSQETA